MGEHIERLRAAVEAEETVALSFLSHVKSYKRTSSTGKVVDVKAYTRRLSQMSLDDLNLEMHNATGDRGRLAQIANEVRRRKEGGTARLEQLRNEKKALAGDDALEAITGVESGYRRAHEKSKTSHNPVDASVSPEQHAKNLEKALGRKPTDAELSSSLRRLEQKGLTRANSEDPEARLRRESHERTMATLRKTKPSKGPGSSGPTSYAPWMGA